MRRALPGMREAILKEGAAEQRTARDTLAEW